MKKASNKEISSDTSVTKLAALNQISASWKAMFGRTPPPIPLQFTVNDRNELLLDGIVIDSLSNVSALDAEVGYECLFLSHVRPGCYYRIHIIWAYTDDIYIDEISLVIHSHAA